MDNLGSWVYLGFAIIALGGCLGEGRWRSFRTSPLAMVAAAMILSAVRHVAQIQVRSLAGMSLISAALLFLFLGLFTHWQQWRAAA